jgi:hypothetical protein
MAVLRGADKGAFLNTVGFDEGWNPAKTRHAGLLGDNAGIKTRRCWAIMSRGLKLRQCESVFEGKERQRCIFGQESGLFS